MVCSHWQFTGYDRIQSNNQSLLCDIYHIRFKMGAPKTAAADLFDPTAILFDTEKTISDRSLGISFDAKKSTNCEKRLDVTHKNG